MYGGIDRVRSSVEVEWEILAEPEIFYFDQSGMLGHLLLDRKVDQLLHHLLLPLPLAPVPLRDHDRLDEVFFLGYDGVYLLLAPEIVLDWLARNRQA